MLQFTLALETLNSRCIQQVCRARGPHTCSVGIHSALTNVDGSGNPTPDGFWPRLSKAAPGRALPSAALCKPESSRPDFSLTAGVSLPCCFKGRRLRVCPKPVSHFSSRAASTGCQAQDRGLCAGCHCSTGERHECSRRRSPQWAPGICLVEKVTGLSFP